jgi:hypothetical protein
MAAFEAKIQYNRLFVRTEKMPQAVRAEVLDAATVYEEALTNLAQSEAPEKTGYLRAHIKGRVSQSARRITGRVTARTKYAAILEWGGTIKAHDIAAKNAGALAFLRGAEELYRLIVHHPVSIFEDHPYMHKAFEQMEGEIVAGLEGAVNRGLAAS